MSLSLNLAMRFWHVKSLQNAATVALPSPKRHILVRILIQIGRYSDNNSVYEIIPEEKTACVRFLCPFKNQLRNMNNTDNTQGLINHYKGFIMNGGDMSPAINEGDHMVVDLEQNVIRSGEIYIVEYRQSNVVCRLLRDGEKVKLIFDGAVHSIDVLIKEINVIGRVIEVKILV